MSKSTEWAVWLDSQLPNLPVGPIDIKGEVGRALEENKRELENAKDDMQTRLDSVQEEMEERMKYLELGAGATRAAVLQLKKRMDGSQKDKEASRI